MDEQDDFVKSVLQKLSRLRQASGLTEAEIEERLSLGPGWVRRFETAESIPTLDEFLAILGAIEHTPNEVLGDATADQLPKTVRRHIYAEQDGSDLVIRFDYAKHDASYRLGNATVSEYDSVIKTLRDGLAKLSGGSDNADALKADAVASTFLEAVTVWPKANPSDLWWFVVYRAYFDPFNHPAEFARLDFGQSWKRTAGWALEEILVRHYKEQLSENGVDICIVNGDEKRLLVEQFDVPGMRIEADKVDVFLVGMTRTGRVPFGIVHVKASFAERRTDDVPLSQPLVSAGYTSPLWTMDCKSSPAALPVNKGELGKSVAPGEARDTRSAKRKDIEDDGFFSACFS